jgi:iron complex transport system substrate-binding protein
MNSRSLQPFAASFRFLALIPLLALAAFAQPRRVVSTAPSFTETVYALGAGDLVVGVSVYCHFPKAVDKLPKVGTYLEPDIEAIVRLKPDLVLVHKEQPQVSAQLNRLGLRTLSLANTSLQDTFDSIRDVGAALQMPTQAAKLTQSIRGRFDVLRKASAGKPRKTLLFIVGRSPGRLEGLVAVGKGSFLNELISIAGGRNAFENSAVTYPTISLEGVLRIDPDVIVDMGDMSETVGVTGAHKHEVVDLWRTQSGLKSARSKGIYAVAADIFVVPGPRVADAAEAFAQMLSGVAP